MQRFKCSVQRGRDCQPDLAWLAGDLGRQRKLVLDALLNLACAARPELPCLILLSPESNAKLAGVCVGRNAAAKKLLELQRKGILLSSVD